MKFNRLFSLLLALCLVATGIGVAPASPVMAQSVSVQGVSPAGMLNPDGTLALDGSFSGSLDLSGFSVGIDPVRGPVFGPASSGEASPQTVPATNQWGTLGSGGGVFNGAISDIAVSGTDVYVVGSFLNAGGIPAADRVAKWDGYSWSALGDNGYGNGAVWWSISTVAVNGSNVYIGGSFSNVSDNGTTLNAADSIAMWDGTHWNALGNDGAGDGTFKSGYIYDMVFIGSNLYVGGYFTDINNKGTVLGAADYLAKWDGSNWSAVGSNGAGDGSLNGQVTALATDGSGNLYVGGSFTNVESGTVFGTLQSADYIAKWNGSSWSALGTGSAPDYGSLNGSVYAIATSGTNVYVGGNFNFVNNKGTQLTSAGYIAKFDGSNWSALGSNGANGNSLNSGVSDIVVSGSNVFVSGGFTNVNNNGTVRYAADYVAKWNGTTWSALGTNGSGNGSLEFPKSAYGTVMAQYGGYLLLGGVFMDVNSGGTIQVQADYLAQWDGTGWSSVGLTTSGTLTGDVNAVAVIGTDVYVGGSFQNAENYGINIPEADYIAKWNGTTWSALGSDGSGNGSLNDIVHAITVSGSNLYVGGEFNSVRNSDGSYVVGGDSIVRWDGTKWYGLGNDGTGGGPIWGRVFAIAVSGSNVYAGGIFYDVKNNSVTLNNADYIAKFNGTSWSALGSNGAGNGSLTNTVEAIAVIGSDVYVGGSFSDVNNNGTVIPEADYIAKWDGANWSALSSNGAGNGALNSSVNALAVSGTNLYLGGSFYNVYNNGIEIPEADYIAKWDGSNWSALGSNGAGNGALNGSVQAISIKGSSIYVGGRFTDTQNNNTTIGPADYIAKFDGTNWSALGSNGAGNGVFNDAVTAIAVSGLNLYAGGWFTNMNINGQAYADGDYIAQFRLPTTKVIFRSNGAQDGWVLESGEKTNLGKTLNTSATALRLGDDSAKKQYRTILSFSTKALPDNAVITKITLKVRRQGVVPSGSNPLNIFQGFMVDIKKGIFGTAALQSTDFQTAASKSYGPFKPALVNGWYNINLTTGKTFINKLATSGGLTQLRLRFKLDDNNNGAANYLSLYSGNAPLTSRPQLIVEYYVP